MISIIGGTGPEGTGLAIRFAQAGEAICIGSRDAGRAEEAAHRIRALVPTAEVVGRVNQEAATVGETVFITLPYRAVSATLAPLQSTLAGKLVVSVVATIEFVQGRPVPIAAAAGSAAQEIAALLPAARIVSGFHTLSAEKLANLAVELNEDTIICGDDRADRKRVMMLAERIGGVRAINGGRLANSYYPEQFVGMLAALNRLYNTHSGLRITDV
jgi:NADPH-dependent F420 reductase